MWAQKLTLEKGVAMKHAIFLCFLIALVLAYLPTPVLAQSQQALDACRNVNPAGAWRECLQRYDQRLWELQQDPQWWEQQRQLQLQEQYRQQQLELQRRQVEQQRQWNLQQQRQQQETQRRLRDLENNQNNNRGLSFMCRDAIGRGDSGGVFVFCN